MFLCMHVHNTSDVSNVGLGAGSPNTLRVDFDTSGARYSFLLQITLTTD